MLPVCKNGIALAVANAKNPPTATANAFAAEFIFVNEQGLIYQSYNHCEEGIKHLLLFQANYRHHPYFTFC